MSFHKRIFDKENIKRNSKTFGFNSFDTWILSPDAYIFRDDFSHQFVKAYGSLPKGYRKELYSEIKNIQDDDLFFSIIKILLVNYNEKNNQHHTDCIEKYNELFFVRWSKSILPSQAYKITKILGK